MKFKYEILVLILNFVVMVLVAQTSNYRTIVFLPVYNNAAVYLDSVIKSGSGDSIQFETFKFYISNIEFSIDDKTVWKEEKSFHLMDASNRNAMNVKLPKLSNIGYNKIKFNLGIDSITNTSGAMGGDLDPTKGMYWAWQNGYINFKLEGKSNVCKSRNNEFQFHLGGYQYPYNAIQVISLDVLPGKTTEIVFDLEKLISGMDLSSQNHIMSPCKEAIVLSKKASDVFSIQVK
jgi:hypothetical protein